MPGLKSRIGAVVIPRLPVNRRTLDILRHEAQAVRTVAANRLSPRRAKLIKTLRHQRELSLNLGSGGQGLPGWINIELRRHHDTTICLDIRRKLPFSDGSVRRIFAEQVIEHI